METRPDSSPAQTAVANEPETAAVPKTLTVAQNAILTVKVLVGFGLIGLMLWGIEIWTASR